jgi:hypothetical protein
VPRRFADIRKNGRPFKRSSVHHYLTFRTDDATVTRNRLKPA